MSSLLKKYAPISFISLALIGLFFSRALLSISTVGLFATQLFFYRKEYSWNVLKQSWPYWSIAVILLLSLISGVYSTSMPEWWQRSLVKLPLLLLALALLTLHLNDVEVFAVHQLVIILALAGSLYSVGQYYLYHDVFLQQYQYANVLPTPMYGDHIRFSWCVYIGILFCVHTHSQINKRHLKAVNALIGLWFFVYLHILGSKTGLFMAYSGMLIFILFMFKKWRWYYKLGSLISLIVFPIVAYVTLPSFKQRLHYIKYDYEQYSKGNFASGLSDGVRVLSIKAAVAITKEHPVVGVGVGDVRAKTIQWYQDKAPQLRNYEHFLPISQFAMVAASFGILGLVLFILSIFVPYWFHKKEKLFSMYYIPAALGLSFEPHLEGQISVFVFGFFTLWFLILAKNNNENGAATN